jgi:hypothetical protein
MTRAGRTKGMLGTASSGSAQGGTPSRDDSGQEPNNRRRGPKNSEKENCICNQEDGVGSNVDKPVRRVWNVDKPSRRAVGGNGADLATHQAGVSVNTCGSDSDRREAENKSAGGNHRNQDKAARSPESQMARAFVVFQNTTGVLFTKKI